LDIERSSKIRALALASRCLAREIKCLKEAPPTSDMDESETLEIERVVHLARAILDPNYTRDDAGYTREDAVSPLEKAKPSALAKTTFVAHVEPALPSSKSAASSSNGRAAKRSDDLRIDLLGDGPPSPRHTMALLGHGTRIPIPEIVGFLGGLGADGILRVGTRKELYLVEFGGGQIVHAEASSAPLGHRLGDILVSQGSIDRIALESASSEEASWKLGRHLVEEELISREQLVRALQTQIQLLFCRLFREEAQSLTFWSGPRLYGEEGVRLNSTSLLLEGARVNDEAADGLRSIGKDRLEGEG
jgi:hypothetical protein